MLAVRAEAGVTHLRVDPGALAPVRTAGAGGAVLTGGTGADLFVFRPDGVSEPGYRLPARHRPSGPVRAGPRLHPRRARIPAAVGRHHDRVRRRGHRLLSDDGRAIDPARFTAADLLDGFGYAGADEALARFRQAGTDTMFQDQGTTITFPDTAPGAIHADMLIL